MPELKVIPYSPSYLKSSFNRIIVKPIQKEASINEGLIIPADVGKICEIGIVFASGEKSTIKKGDKVLYRKIERTAEHLDIISYEDELYDVLYENEVWAVNDYPFNKIFVAPISDMEISGSGLLIPNHVKGITQKGIVFRTGNDWAIAGDNIEYRKAEQEIYPSISIEGKLYDVLTDQDIFTVNGKVSPYRIIVRIDKIAQQAKQTQSDSGLLRSQLFLFMLHNLQYGEVLEIGEEAKKLYPDLRVGDTAILHHSVEDKTQNYRVIKQEVSKHQILRYEHRIINAWETSNREIFGKVSNRKEMIIVPYGKSVFLDWDFEVLQKNPVTSELFTDFETNLDKCTTLNDLTNTIAHKKKSYTDKAMAKVRGYRKLLAGITNPAEERETFQRYESLLKEAERDALKVGAYCNANHLLVCKRTDTNERVIATYKELYPINVLGKKYLIAHQDYIISKLDNMTIKPLENRLIVKPIEDNKHGELLLPDSAKEKPQFGKVISVGTGKEGKPMEAKIGDTVFYKRNSGIPFPSEYFSEEGVYLLMTEGVDTFAVVSDQ